MPDIKRDFTEKPRPDLHVFYVLDTSGSMTGNKISELNRAMEETVLALKDVAKTNGDAKLKIAVMEFNTDYRWVTTNGPEDLEGDFIWDPLKEGGLTDIGSALTELNKKLSQSEFLCGMAGAMMPIIIFMTDGFATDNYEKALGEIRENKWFKRATKIGFALGDDADLKMISTVVGNSEAVIRTSDLELFKKLMRFVSVTASMLVSESKKTNKAPTAKEIIDIAKQQLDLPEDTTANLNPDSYDPEPEQTWDDDDDEGGW